MRHDWQTKRQFIQLRSGKQGTFSWARCRRCKSFKLQKDLTTCPGRLPDTSLPVTVNRGYQAAPELDHDRARDRWTHTHRDASPRP